MYSEPSSSSVDRAHLETLTRQLLDIAEQIQTLTGGEVDAVVSPTGRSFLLPNAQQHLATSESEQRALVVELGRQRALLLQIQAMVKLGSWTLDPATAGMTVSAGLGLILEFHSELQTQTQFLDLVEGEDRTAFANALELTLNDGQERTAETRLRLPSGAIKVVEHHWRAEGDRADGSLRLVGTCQDITERREMEEQLRRQRAQLDLAGRLGKIGAYTFVIGASHVSWSDQICAIHEVPPGTTPSLEEAIGFYLPDSRVVIEAAFAKCVQLGTPYDLELEIKTGLGRHRWVRAMAEAVADEAHGIVGIQGAFQDISDRKQAQDARTQLSARLASTFENLDSAFFTLDHDWCITYVNARMEQKLGIVRQDLLGLNLWECIPELTGTPFEALLREAMAERTSKSLESYLVPFFAWCLTRVHGSGEVLAVYIRDISEEHDSRQELELLQRCVSQISDVLLVTEATPVDEPGPRILYANDAHYRLTGYTPEEVLGNSPRMFQGSETDRIELGRIREAILLGESVSAEVKNYSKNGSAYWVEMQIEPVRGEDGVLTHFIAVQRDITERKQSHERLRELAATLETRVAARTVELEAARREAELANSAKSVFLATMSHEIRTPMAGVIGMIDVLRKTALQADQSEIVDLLDDSALSLLTIIDNVLDFSKIEAGRLLLESVPLNLGDSIERICAMLYPTAASRDVELYVFIDPAMPEELIGDPTRIRQVLVNLIGNAIKFSSGRDKTGQVWVRVTRMADTSRGTKISISIADNGIGMDAEALSRLFTAFDQADLSTTRRFGGTGLGLAITRSLVGLMDGEISVRSTPGIGSEFEVQIVLMPCNPTTGETAQPTDLQGIACHIVGTWGNLAADLAATLGGAGATILPWTSADAAPAHTEESSPLVWILLPGQSCSVLPQSTTRCVELGIGGPRRPEVRDGFHVTLDVRAMSRRHLCRAVAIAGGHASHRADLTGQFVSIVSTAAAAQSNAVLVAEDNEMNREVIRRQLGLLGYAAEIAHDGRQALELWRRGHFSMLLTDLRMPEMDGYALTSAIRSEESAGNRMPIVALTANALPEESARCRAVGMDDYLTKPLLLEALRAVLEKLIPADNRHVGGPDAALVPQKADMPADLAVLRSMIGSDPSTTAAMLKTYRTGARHLRAELMRAAAAHDSELAIAAAHRLKSNAYAIGAKRLGDLCVLIENADGSRTEEELKQQVHSLEAEAIAVDDYLLSLDHPPRSPET